MSAPSLLRRWLLACSLSVLAVVLAGLLIARRNHVTSAGLPLDPVESAPAESACQLPPLESARALPGAEAPPVILWASGDVRLYLDGAGAFSPPEMPRHYEVGEHTIRLEADGHAPFSLKVRFDAWTPALLHAELDPMAGLTLVRVNAPCVDCRLSITPVDEIRVDPSRGAGDPILAAAEALRRDDWTAALDQLAQVPEEARDTPIFHRLASVVHMDSHAPDAGLEQLLTMEGPRGEELRPLIERQQALFEEEEARRHGVQLTRWNRATERYGALVARYGVELPRATGLTGSRLEALSRTFSTHHQNRDILGAEEALLAAEEALLELAKRLRASRPNDCTFQADVVRVATTD